MRIPAEKCYNRSTKKANVLKQKYWTKMGIPATSTRCPDHLSRQFLTTVSTFPYSSKNSSAEHIHAFYTYMSLCAWVSVCVCVWVSVSEWVSVWVCVFVYVSECVLMVSHIEKACICSAEKFLELYGKVEAVVRNSLLSWSGHLFEVTGTHLFDQSFCFKHNPFLCSDRRIFPLVRIYR